MMKRQSWRPLRPTSRSERRSRKPRRPEGFVAVHQLASGGSGRNFGALNLRGSIVAKLEQVKARTRCHTCGQLGHWKRECPRRTAAGSNKPAGSKEVMIVEDDMYDEADLEELFQRLNAAEGTKSAETLVIEQNHDQSMSSVSEVPWGALSQASIDSPQSDADLGSPIGATAHDRFSQSFVFESFTADQEESEASEDYVARLDRHGVPDTACRRSLIGEHVLHDLEEHLKGLGRKVVRRKCMSSFRFGNAGELVSHEVAQIPCNIGHRKIVMQVAVLPTPGERTPLLMSKEMLKALGAYMDMNDDSMTFTKLGVTVRMGVTSKGHYAVPLFDGVGKVCYSSGSSKCDGSAEVLSSDTHSKQQTQHSAAHGDQEQSQAQAVHQDDEPWCIVPHESRDAQAHSGAGKEERHARDDHQGRSTSRPRGGFSTPRADEWKHASHGREVQGAECHHAGSILRRQGLPGLDSNPHQREVGSSDEDLEGLHRDEGSEESREIGARANRSRSTCQTEADAQSATHAKPNDVHAESRDGDATQQQQLVGDEWTTMPDVGNSKESRPNSQLIQERMRPWRDGGGQQDTSGPQPSGCGKLGRLCPDGHHDGGGEKGAGIPEHSERGGASARFGSSSHDRADDDSAQGVDLLPDMVPGPAMTMNRRMRRTLRQSIESLIQQSQDTSVHGKKSHEVLLGSGITDRIHGEGMHDVSEVFSVPRMVKCASKKGMFPGMSYDLVLGDNLLKTDQRKRVLEELRRDKPFCVVVSPPCTMFSRRRRPGDPELDRKEMLKALVLLNFGVQVCRQQMELNRYFVFEHPLGADSWLCKNLVELTGDERVHCIPLDMCAYNLRDIGNGKHHKKPTKVAANLDWDICHTLKRNCDGSHEHQWLEGKVKSDEGWVNRTKLAQEYTPEFCDAVCSCIQQQKRRFMQHGSGKHEVFVHEGLQQEEGSRKMVALIKKVHDNLGHPSSERLCMVLKAAGASDKAISIAKGLKCQVCEQNKTPTLQKVAKVRRTFDFNVGVACDTFELDVGEKGNLNFLSVICEGTNYHLVFPLWHGKGAAETRKAYRHGWKAVFGSPIRCFCDNGSEFEKEFQQGLELDGTADERSASESPWQNGLCERHGGIWKNMFKKCFETTNPTSRDEIEEIVEQVNVAKNSLIRKDGFAPNQRIFGKDVRIPGLLYSGDDHVGINSAILAGDHNFCRSMEIRQTARTAFMEADNDERIRRTIDHRSRPERGPFPPGSKVYVWRHGNQKKKSSRQSMFWRGPGTVIGSSDNCTKFWVSLGTKVLKCSPEQLRRLLPEQEALVKMVPKELIDWNKQVSKRGVATFHDISAEPKPNQDGRISDYWEMTGNIVRRVHAVPRTRLYSPVPEDDPPVGLEELQDTRTSRIVRLDGSKETLYDNWRSEDLEEKLEIELHDMAQWTGDTEFVLRKRDREPELETERHTRARSEFQASQQNGDNFPEQVEIENDVTLDSDNEIDTTVTPDDDTVAPEGVDAAQANDAPLPEPIPAASAAADGGYGPVRTTPLTRALRRDLNLLDSGTRTRQSEPQDVMVVDDEAEVKQKIFDQHQIYVGHGWRIDWENQTLMKMHSDRNCKYTPKEGQCPLPLNWLTGARVTAARFKSSPNKLHYITDDFLANEKPNQRLADAWTGFTILAFDLPLQNDNPEDEPFEVNEVDLKTALKYSDIDQGKLTELEKLLRYEAIKIVPPKEADKIRRDPILGKRILPSRFVVTKKPDEKTGQVKTKCRWCIRGYLDPDLTELSTQSPTVSQEALMASLQICASNNWKILIADIEGAFLQGDKLHREHGELHVEVPPDGFPRHGKRSAAESCESGVRLGRCTKAMVQENRRCVT